MPDVRKCAIYGCRSNSRDHRDLKFFNFPARDSPLYDTWLSICHESADILRSIQRPYICSNHFHPRHVGFRRLALGAVPTLLLKAPPGFLEEEMARVAKEAAAEMERKRLFQLINDSVFEWVKRAQHHSEFGKTLCTSRRELQRVGIEIRNLLGATLTFNIDDYWLRKFRQTHLCAWDSDCSSDDQQIMQTLDLVEIIHSIDPDAKISSKEEIAILVEEKERRVNLTSWKKTPRSRSRVPFQHCPPLFYSHAKTTGIQESKNKSFVKTVEEFYGIDSKNTSPTTVKSEKLDSVDLSQDDDGCFDVNSEDSGPEVASEPIVETYQQALEHLKPLEDFVLRQENYRAIGLLSTLEIIFKNPR